MLAEFKATTWKLLAKAYYYSGLAHVRNRGRVAIVTYHRVVPYDMVRAEHIQPGMYVRTESFESHAAYLREQFVVLPFAGLLERWRTDGLDSSKRYCVITFDDGWHDNYRYAFPVLKKYGLPATIFLATDYIGTSRWFWPDELAYVLGRAREQMMGEDFDKALMNVVAEMSTPDGAATPALRLLVESDVSANSDRLIEKCKNLPPKTIAEFVRQLGQALGVRLPNVRVLLDWNEVKEMAKHNITFGAHSRSHQILTNIPLVEVEDELIESREALVRHDLAPVPVFCYPNGNFDREIQSLTKAAGYLGAVGCEVGLETGRPHDTFALKRISVHEDAAASDPLFALTLSGLR
ncbi:MAG: polysaccharide deacetylase family protein [Nitrospira sp.]|nr:polysaccharide deacetylase family protein [Nitrospira sp.]